MLITPIEHGLDLSQALGIARTPGVHMSDLFNAYYAKLEPKRYGKRTGDEAKPMERWALGLAFEEALEEWFKRRFIQCAERNHRVEQVERPGELETAHQDDCPRKGLTLPVGYGCRCGGGVLYSPDLLIFNGITRVGEIKLNTMSVKGVPWKLGETYTSFHDKFSKYVCQMKLYCKHIGTLYARLYSFSVREMVYFNEYDILRGWDITFTQRELDDEWDNILRFANAERMLK